MRLKILPLVLAMTLLGKGGIGAAEPDQSRDTIIAIVNKEAITYKDLEQYLSAVYMNLAAEGRSKEEIKEIMTKNQSEGLSRLIEDRLLVAEADKKEVTIKDFAVDERLAELKKNYTSNEDFMNDLKRQGLTISDLRKKIADQIKAKYIIDTEVKSKVYIHPNEVNEFYKQNDEKFLKPERAEIDSIFIPYREEQKTFQNEFKLKSEGALDSSSGREGKLGLSPSVLNLPPLDDTTGENAPYNADEKVHEVLFAYRSGIDFGRLVEKYSAMPSLGTVSRGELLPEIENAVFTLKEGEVSAPIKTENGIFIFRMKQKLPPGKATLDEAKDSIYKTLYAQKFQKRFATLMDDLKKKAYIEIKN